ncbi:hypothetical protein P261_02649 [Lachnospiraceae bacterium TWA4]|nr:hypothetical protein P261_02649 [Lachnospiraceae bacterium TWA4]
MPKSPLIIYNGAMIVDNCTGEFIQKNFFGSDVTELLEDLFENGIYPIVYSFIEDIEKFSFIPEKCTEEVHRFLETRCGDQRTRVVENKEQLQDGEIFYITCIDKEQKLAPLYDKYKDMHHCVFQKDIYTGDQWFEIMPKSASKSNAIKQLQEKLGCDYLIVFGDGKNDVDMFEIADEAYAVENAVEELKAVATGIISSNNSDGVAKWLEKNY